MGKICPWSKIGNGPVKSRGEGMDQLRLDSEKVRTGSEVEALKLDMAETLLFTQGRYPAVATSNDRYMAVSYSVRDRLLFHMLNTLDTLFHEKYKLVCYFSAEYLLGPELGINLVNLGITEASRKALEFYGIDLEQILEQEKEPGLGNGGLGRLAACYMDSLSTLEVPALGYGIRYEFGMFNQEIKNGWQVEQTDKWLSQGNPWEIARPEIEATVKLGGYTTSYYDDKGTYRVRWNPERMIKGTAYDTVIAGYKSNICNILRLWKADAVESFDFEAFNVGDYYKAVEEKMFSENITKILYPNDEALKGKQLRLEQQYFLVSCSLQDMIRLEILRRGSLKNFHESFAAQLNDTHPSLAIPELMRLLVDEHQMPWDEAYEITVKTFSYTNHTLLPEALEKWPLRLFQSLLPRHLEIIYEINQRFLDQVRVRYPDDIEKIRRMSIIDEYGEKYVRMANLACIGSHAVNGVAPLHTELLKKELMPDFVEFWPSKFFNITNGISPRRFLLLSNPKLAELISSKIGSDWIKDLEELKKLTPFADDRDFQKSWHLVKLGNKKNLAKLIKTIAGVELDPETLFDVQVKRIHEYKRQHLNVLHIITLYNRIRANPKLKITPRSFIFGGKAAPSYRMAKLMIKLINSVADVINQDPIIEGRLKVVFFPNYNVKNAQKIFPGAELSEQISLAGKEASGTGNMKLSLNGALTIGTYDGANIQIREEVGKENFFLFGLKAKEAEELKRKGYHPLDYYNKIPELREAVDMIRKGFFSHGDAELFKPLVDLLLNVDPYMVFADYESYIECQDRVSKAYLDESHWTKMSILNVAHMGLFSSDRAISEYCTKIWGVEPICICKQDLIEELYERKQKQLAQV